MFLIRKRDPLPSRDVSELCGQISKRCAPALLLSFGLLSEFDQLFLRRIARSAEVTFYRVKSALPRDESVEVRAMRRDGAVCAIVVGLWSAWRHVFIPQRAMPAVRPRKQSLADSW